MPLALQHQTLDLPGLLDPRGGGGKAQSRGLWAVEVGASREIVGVIGGFSWMVAESARSRVAAFRAHDPCWPCLLR